MAFRGRIIIVFTYCIGFCLLCGKDFVFQIEQRVCIQCVWVILLIEMTAEHTQAFILHNYGTIKIQQNSKKRFWKLCRTNNTNLFIHNQLEPESVADTMRTEFADVLCAEVEKPKLMTVFA